MKRRRVLLATTVALAIAGSTGVATTAFAEESARGFVNVAHRGGGGYAPEMTDAAFSLLPSQHPDVTEVDVQLSADGVPVLMHDATLQRTTDVADVFPGRAADLVNTFTLAELKQLDAGSWYHDRFAGEEVLTLDDVLDYVQPHGIGVFIELKDPAANPGVEQAIADVMNADPRWADMIADDLVTFTSFDQASLKRMTALQPEPPLVWVNSTVPSDTVLAEAATWADEFGTHYRTLNGATDIARIKATGMRAMLYTLNSPDVMQEGLDLGADTLITDFSGALSAVESGGNPVPQANGIVVKDVVADPPGSDLQPETGEHVVLTNVTSERIWVSGYYLNDAVINTLVVGSPYYIDPGAELRVYTGPGTNSPTKYYNDLGRNVLNNNGDSIAVFTSWHALVDLYAYT
ncbi:glycerophosphoryl diester phosphodiesterase [Stackebrandtia endophytica]|uniref:Glycerophosphoryl diester phosphodiesterase n=1 Tax=Stackebrandtia endophytica TaxID=1496996 RepID=A0A543B1Z3_9ACTN|nr:glycerophosphodiester phosphodiesterase family protein [Stackebrandtia endophytica]TQL78844.1 glycerophosphoryl diester phosphodiesterase [Stackebrandtia endophytica]